MKVTVGVPTYNHGPYIRQALQSIVDQVQDGFELEVLIFDDCSTDSTSEICKEFENRYNFVKFMPSEVNLGLEGNGPRVFANCKGNYIAFCDGDDYWTDKFKLVKQLRAFQNNERISVVYHNVEINKNQVKVKNIYDNAQPEYISFDDLLGGQFMKTSAVMLKYTDNMFDPIVKRELPSDDTSLCFLALENGGLGFFINEVMAVYRVHDKGVWSNIEERKKLEWSVRSLKRYIKYYLGKYDLKPLQNILTVTQGQLLMLSMKQLNIKRAESTAYDMLKVKMGQVE